MTFAWYGHLKITGTEVPLWKIIVGSWLIAFFEYCLMVPANRIGRDSGFTVFQLKIAQEVITLSVFVVFARFYLGAEAPRWNHIAAFALLFAAAWFAFLPAEKSG
jgi:uncharacterized protein (DUF486 family)